MIDIQNLPHLIKYMGSKREILNYVVDSIKDLNIDSNQFCDLFSGTAIVSAALRDEYNILSNDIQCYSSIFCHTYFSNLNQLITSEEIKKIEKSSIDRYNEFKTKYPQFNFDYSDKKNYEQIKTLELQQQNLINYDFGIGFNLFAKCYSGTYWSYDQCVWIDSIRSVAEDYEGTPKYYAILSALIFAMSYSSQSTGHFAQFRDITKSNMNDILIYRHKDIFKLFSNKLTELIAKLNVEPKYEYKITTLDYMDCLRLIKDNTIVYADPPYSAVHYSRFYHAIETLVRYDHPTVKYKGRYREDRYQSPFDKKTKVKDAFRLLMESVKYHHSHLILSYSDNGMITPEDLCKLGHSVFGKEYEYNILSKKYMHSKMGRSDDYQMGVNELIISFKRK
jgi:adenine-specific DNA-methyltransferase